MNKRHMLYVGLVLLAAMVLFGAPLTASAAVHPNVTLFSAPSVTVTATTPYSTKITCGGCHFDCATGAYSTVKTTWCDNGVVGNQKDCSVAGNCPDYASMATAETSHSHGYPNASGTVSFMTYTIKEAVHGASTGIHSQHGRNETLSAAQRTIWGAPAFIGGTGMYGRY